MRTIQGYGLLLVLLVSGFGADMSRAQTSSTGSGQGYPAKPVRILTGPAGGGTDIVARIVALELSTPLGQSVIVENRPAGPALAVAAAQAAPDGYTLMVNASSLWIAPLIGEVSYDTIRDFAPIVTLARVTTLLVVHPSLPVRSVAELIKLAKAKPGQLNIATGPLGGLQHIAAESFKSMANVDILSVAYKGGPQPDVLAGRVEITFNPPGVWAAHIKSGRVRALASTSAQRSLLFPDLPTVGETLPGYVAEGLNALFVRAKTPDAIVRRLNQETNRVIEKPEVRERLLNAGLEPVGGAPEQLTDTIKSEIARVSKIIKNAGIKSGGN